MKDWSNLTLKEFIEIKKIMDKEVSDFEKSVEILNLLYHRDFNACRLTEYMDYAKSINFLNEEMPKVKFKDRLNINGREYSVSKKMEEITTAQFIDYNNITRGESSMEDKYVDILSIFVLPKGVKYTDDYDTEQVKQDIMDIPFIDASAIAAFFLSRQKRFLIRFQIYLVFMILKGKKTWTEKKAILKNMDFSLM